MCGDTGGLGAWIYTQRQAYRRPENDLRRLSTDHLEATCCVWIEDARFLRSVRRFKYRYI